jgi:hypothetical protein
VTSGFDLFACERIVMFWFKIFIRFLYIAYINISVEASDLKLLKDEVVWRVVLSGMWSSIVRSHPSSHPKFNMESFATLYSIVEVDGSICVAYPVLLNSRFSNVRWNVNHFIVGCM